MCKIVPVRFCDYADPSCIGFWDIVQINRRTHSMPNTLLNGNNLLPRWQSAYRRFHSTETAVTKVFNDLLMAVDRGQMSVLFLLDLSAAMNCCCKGLSISSACVAQCSSGSARICQAGHSALCTVIWCRSLSMSCAQFHKAQSLVCCFSFCTWRILRTGLPSTACLFTPTLTTHSCTSTSPPSSQRNHVIRWHTWALRHGHRPLDVRQQTKTERR